MILVTGCSGFIGSHLLSSLPAGQKVRCFVRPSSASKVPERQGFEIFRGDLRSRSDIQNAMKDVRRIVHLGAQLRNANADQIHQVNVESTRWLIEEAKANSAEHFIFLSSENALREDLDDPYAQTKREAERCVSSFGRSLILRPCFVYGTGDHHGLGRLLDLAFKTPLVPLFGGMKSLIQPLYIEDMVRYLLLGLEKRLTGEYVLAGAEKMALNDFVKKACTGHKKRKLFLPLPYAFWRLTANRVQLQNLYASRTYDISDTVKAFGYAPRTMDENLSRWTAQD